MNIVKHSNESNWLRWLKRRLPFRFIICMVLASLMGTYLDLYYVGKQYYQFPHRPLPEIFSINIAFTLIGLPILVFVYLSCISYVSKWGKVGIILLMSLLMPIFEKLAEVLGWFIHTEEWEHIYTFFGYVVFLMILLVFDEWVAKRTK